MSSDNAKSRATALPRLEWQGELDTALAEIDDRLTHPRRRATDLDRQPVLPELGHVELTNELLDEIAWRVAEQIRNNGQTATVEAVSTALAKPQPQPAVAPRQPAPPAGTPLPGQTDETGLRPGKMVMIRYKLPILPWPLRLLQRRSRKKQHPLTTARLRA